MKRINRKQYNEALNSLVGGGNSPFYEILNPTKTNYIKYYWNKLRNNIVLKQKIRSILHFIRLLMKIRPSVLHDMKKFNISYENALKRLDLAFPKTTKPYVSIIVPVYNKLDITLRCLSSLGSHMSQNSFEVIVVDNASKEPVSKCLKNVPGLKLRTNDENLGYVGGCNSGAELAKGKYIVFLNNDTEVLGGWLDALVGGVEHESVGLVGSKLIYPDGKLQEAGGIIFSDASGNNYGKYKNADSFKYNYTAEVDYVSGASIIIKKDLFDEFGGFDELYSPAYYEDTDLAYKVRDKKLKVVYEPNSVVVHIEGATAGTDIGSGFKKYQAINLKKFAKRWKKQLKKQPSSEDNIYSARFHRHKRNVLFIDNSVPEPDKDSGSVREWAILKILKELDSHITFWPANLVATQPYTSTLQSMSVEVVYGDRKHVNFANEMKEREGVYDVVFMARPFIGSAFIDSVKKYQPQAKIIYDTVDLHYLRLMRKAEIEKSKKLKEQVEDWKVVENYLIQESDQALVVSTTEKELLNEEGYKNIKILSNIHTLRDLKHAPSFKERSGLFFIGSFNHTPNVDAMVWFCNEVLPIIQNDLPDVELTIVGSNPTDEIKELDRIRGVNVLGYLDKVEPVFDSTRIFVSPLRYGAGVKGKVGQSISLGLPIVTTSIGAEGMRLRDGKDCLIRDDAESFAKATIELYEDEKTWNSLQSSSQETLNKHLSVDSAKKVIRNIIGGQDDHK